MTSIAPVSNQLHGHRSWKRFSSYLFASADTIAPLVLREVPKACLSLPIGFVRSDGGFRLVAVQGLEPGTNLLVSTDGRWLGKYIPAAYRGYPFVLANTSDGRQVLAIREDSGLVMDAGGEAFFDADGQPSKAVKEIMDFLEQVQASAHATAGLCALLAEHNLIQPWRVTVKSEEGDRNIEGLFCVDEKALNSLSADAMMALRDGGAMTLAYCQLLSMQNLQEIARLAAEKSSAGAASLKQSVDLDLEFMNDSDTIRFS